MTQPSFVPVADSSAVRRTMATETPEIGRPKKPGLLGSPTNDSGTGRGSPGPDGGYALTLAERAVHELVLEPGESHHDVEVGVAALASKRASLSGRAPCATDVDVALDLFEFRVLASERVLADRLIRFRGLGHDYFALRRFVDGISDAILRQAPSAVLAIVR
jgi:hypothetical protein